ncbi:MAG: hypothetical protein PHV30_10690 [Candidatus Margulisbacteria bacterium]|nr:hypothetical protein [Candidatus Margulisiibacteriota bacterium]
MLKYYLSPSGLSFFEYTRLCHEFTAFGWQLTWSWPSKFFDLDQKPNSDLSTQAVKAIGDAELFIAFLPGRFNTHFEIGLAYAWANEIVLAAPHIDYLNDYNAYVSHHVFLPGIVNFICEPLELPQKLKDYYLYLVAN